MSAGLQSVVSSPLDLNELEAEPQDRVVGVGFKRPLHELSCSIALTVMIEGTPHPPYDREDVPVRSDQVAARLTRARASRLIRFHRGGA